MSYDLKSSMTAQLRAAGLDPSKFTESQMWLMTEPGNAPENFYCDGELSHSQAIVRWRKRMTADGISSKDIDLADRMNFKRRY